MQVLVNVGGNASVRARMEGTVLFYRQCEYSASSWLVQRVDALSRAATARRRLERVCKACATRVAVRGPAKGETEATLNTDASSVLNAYASTCVLA